MRTTVNTRLLRRSLSLILLLVGAGTIAGCVYDPYTGTYVPCCTYYRPWGYPYPPPPPPPYGYPAYYRPAAPPPQGAPAWGAQPPTAAPH